MALPQAWLWKLLDLGVPAPWQLFFAFGGNQRDARALVPNLPSEIA